jgi:chromosome segregation ATPase
MQQLASDKTRLEAENAKLKKDADDAHKELDALKKAQKAVDQHAAQSAAALAHSKSETESAEEQLKQTKDKLEQLIAKFRETAQTLRDVEADGTKAKQSLSTREQQLQVCAEHNVALYKINEEALAYIDRQGFWSHVAAAEPFTKIKRIQNENLVDDYKARADDQRVSPPAPPGTPAAPPASSK